MPNQCVHCGTIYPDASRELLEGCKCGSHFFYYIREMPKSEEGSEKSVKVELSDVDKKRVEKDVREIIGIEDEEIPVILDLESIKITGPGKYEIDVVNLFDKRRPLIYKLDEGKYIIDLASTLKVGMGEIRKKIRRPERQKKIVADEKTEMIEIKEDEESGDKEEQA